MDIWRYGRIKEYGDFQLTLGLSHDVLHGAATIGISPKALGVKTGIFLNPSQVHQKNTRLSHTCIYIYTCIHNYIHIYILYYLNSFDSTEQDKSKVHLKSGVFDPWIRQHGLRFIQHLVHVLDLRHLHRPNGSGSKQSDLFLGVGK